METTVEGALKRLAEVRKAVEDPSKDFPRAERDQKEGEQIKTLHSILSYDINDTSALESICTQLFQKPGGILGFLDVKSWPTNQKPSPENREEGFKLLTLLLERMHKKGLLKVHAEALRDVKDVCQDACLAEAKSAKIKEHSLGPLVYIMRSSEACKVLSEEDAVDLFTRILKTVINAKESSVDNKTGPRKNYFVLLGLICRGHKQAVSQANFCNENALEAFMKHLFSEIKFTLYKEKMRSVLSGCIDGLSALLDSFEKEACSFQEGMFLETAYVAVCNSIADLVDESKTVARYELVVSALGILANHSQVFSEWFHSTRVSDRVGADTVCKSLFDLSAHKNSDVRHQSLRALDSWLGCLRIGLSNHVQPLTSLLDLFLKKSAHAEMREKLSAIRGYGALASTMVELGHEAMLNEAFVKASGVIEGLLSCEVDSVEPVYLSEVLSQLPDLVIAFSDMISDLPQVSMDAVDFLDKTVHALFQSYATVHSSRRYLYGRAWFYLLSSLDKPQSAAFQLVVERTIFPALVTSIQPSTSPDSASPGMLAEGRQKPQPCVAFAALWKSLEADDNSKWIKQRGREGFGKGKIVGRVYHQMFKAIIQILEKLDLSLEVPAQEVPEDDEQAAEQEQSDALASQSEGLTGFTAQASGMSGQERPRCQRDFDMFLNLVLFCQLVMKDMEPDFFRNTYSEICKTLVRASSKHPLVSGFFKLLSQCMRIMDRGSFLRGAGSQGAFAPDDRVKQASEASLCSLLVSKFAKEVVARSDQLFDDLLASCLEFVLSLPAQLRDLSIQVPALKGALKLGIDCPPMAVVALDSLEQWIDCCISELRRYLPEILPLLNDFLILPEADDDLQSGAVESSDKRKNRELARRRRVRFRGRHADKKSLEEDERLGMRIIALRAMRLLGKLGSENVWLVQGSVDSGTNTVENLDTNMDILQLQLDFSTNGTAESFFLDTSLPRIVHLAEKSIDRKLKIAACEVLHAIVTLSVGRHASLPPSKSSERSADHKKFDSLFRFIFPIVIRLAVNVETVTAQLFEPLAGQLIHWFASRQSMEAEADILLDALLEGIQDAADGKVREASSKLLAEYVRWILKELKSEKDQEEAIKTKQLLRRLYSYMNHPSVSKRIGAFLAVRELGKSREGLRRFPRVIDQYLLELMHHCILSLKFADRDDPALQTPKAGVAALYGLADGILLRPDIIGMLSKPRQGSHILQQRRKHDDLGHFVAWLFSQIGSHERECRRYCMELFSKIAGKVPGCKVPEDWVREHALDNLCNTFEKEHLRNPSSASTLAGEVARLQHLVTALDGYEWVLNASYARPESVFKRSKVVDAVKAFVTDQAITKLPAKFSEASTPSELIRYANEKAKCLYALFKLVGTLLERFPHFDLAASPACILVDGAVFRALFLSLLAPGTLELDVVSDPLVFDGIPRQAERLMKALVARDEHKNRVHKELVSVAAAPELRLSGQDFLKSPLLGMDELRILFRSYDLLARLDILPRQDDVGRELMERVWDASTKKLKLNPADHAVAEGMLRLSFRVMADFSPFWERVTDDINKDASAWQDSMGWRVYEQYKECVLGFLVANFTSAERKCRFIQRVGSSHVSTMLLDLLESLAKIEGGADAPPQYQILQTTAIVDTFLSNFPHIHDLATVRSSTETDDAAQLRRKQATSLLCRIVSLRPERALDTENAPQVCKCFTALMQSTSPLLNANNAAEALALLPSIVDLAPEYDRDGTLRKLSNALEDMFPADSNELMTGTDEHQAFAIVFSALMSAVKNCKTPHLFPLLHDLAMKEEKHAFRAQISEALDGYALGMQDRDKRTLADRIMASIRSDTSKDPPSLRTLRNVTSHVCLRLLHACDSTILLDFFKAHWKLILDTIRDADTSVLTINKKICMANVLQSLYQNLKYADIQEEVQPLVGDKKLTSLCCAALKTARSADRPASISNDEDKAVFYLYTRTMHNALCMVLCRTQGGENDTDEDRTKKQKLFYDVCFKELLDKRVWEKLVDTGKDYEFSVMANFQKNRDALSTFRKKRFAETRTPGARMSTSQLAYGSLTQDMTVGFRSFAPSSFAAQFSHMPGEEERISDGSEISIENDELNRNESMRPFLALLEYMNKYLRPIREKSDTSRERPEWVSAMVDSLGRRSPLNVRLFVAKMIINHHKLFLERVHTSPAGVDVSPDMFHPYAEAFFEAFFEPPPDSDHAGGLVYEVSKPRTKDVQGLRGSFNYFLRDICLLWMGWMLPPSKGKRGFTLQGSRQVEQGWAFIKHLQQIMVGENAQVTKSNSDFLEHFVSQWRDVAAKEELAKSSACILDYLRRYTILARGDIMGKDQKKRKLTAEEEKDCAELARAGIQVLLIFNAIELQVLEDADRAASVVLISVEDHKKAFALALKMVLPSTHVNKENRKYSARKMLKPAAAAVAQIMACMAVDPAHEDVRREMCNEVIEQLKAHFCQNRIPDQLLEAMSSIIDMYPDFAGTDFARGQLFQRMSIHGTYLNMIQSMMIAHVACIWKLPEEKARKSAAEEMQKAIAKRLREMLSVNDEKTQMMALRLLTGRSDSGQYEYGGERDEDSGLLPPLPEKKVQECGLLPFLSEDYFCGFWHDIKNVFPVHGTEACRFHFYLMVMDLHARGPMQKLHSKGVHAYLVPALTDPSSEIRKHAFQWWDQRGLPQDPQGRLLAMLENMRSPTGDDSTWISSAAVLLLELSRHNNAGKKKLFDKPLDEQHQFRKIEISTASRSFTQPMAPMFAGGSLPTSASQMGSMFTQTQGGDAGGILATMAGADDDGASTMDLDAGAQEFFANQTQQAGQVVIPQRRSKAKADGAAGSGGGGGSGVSRLGAFAAPLPKSFKTRFYVKDHSKGSQQAIARRQEETQEVANRAKAARSKQISMRRKYRAGEVPDIQIAMDDIVTTLQRVAQEDSAAAKVVLVRLHSSMMKMAKSGRGKMEVDDDYSPRLRMSIESMLNEPTSSDLVESLLEISKASGMKLNSSLVARACSRPQVSTFYQGVRSLESQAMVVHAPQPLQRSESRKRPSGSAFSTSARREDANEMQDDDWVQLSRVYAMLGERDIVLGLCEKISKQEDTREALHLELQGDYDKALQLYKKLLTKMGAVDDGAEAWDGEEPGDLEMDQWNKGVLTCLKGLLDWEQLKGWIHDSVVDEDEDDRDGSFEVRIWNRECRPELRNYMRCLVGMSCVLPEGKDKTDLQEFVEDCWYDDKLEARKQVLKDEFGSEAALALLLGTGDTLIAKDLVKKGMDRFLVEWSSSNSIGFVAKCIRLRSLQRFVELSEYIATVEAQPGAPSPQELIQSWGTRLPTRHDTDSDSWDYILTCRLGLTEKFGKEVQKDSSILRLYLALSKVARSQSSLDVASKYLERAELRGGADLRCAMSRAKLHAARSAASEDSVVKLAEIERAEKALKDLMHLQDQSGSEAARFAALKGRVLGMKVQHCSDEGARARERLVVRSCFQDALFLLDTTCSKRDRSRIDSKVHLRFALFCDSEIDHSNAEWARAGDKSDFVRTYVSSMLQALQQGSIEARAHFPRVLDLLQDSQTYEDARYCFAKDVKGVPPWMMLQWLPQIFSLIARHPVLPCGEELVPVVEAMAKDYPQTVFWAYRVVREDIARNDKRAKQLKQMLHSNSVERFCRALQLLQHPEMQVKIFLDNLLVPLKEKGSTGNQADDVAANKEVAAAYKELYEDCLDENSDMVGQYRRGLIRDLKKWVGALGSDGKLKEDLTLDAVRTMRRNLVTWREKKEVADRKARRNLLSIPLSHLTNQLEDCDVHSADEVGWCIPAQHLSPGFDPVTGEQGFIKVVSCDPTLLVLESMLRPKRLKMRGSDGKEYWWLVKGGDDVRQDERVQQVFRCMNQVLAADSQCALRQLSCPTYRVVPVSKLVGIIEWVKDTEPVGNCILSKAGNKEAINALQGKISNYKEKNFKDFRVVQNYISSLTQANTDKGQAAVDTFTSLIEALPEDLLRKGLMATAQSAQAEFEIRSSFARSLSTLSMCGYVLGIGDRHTSNLLVHKPTGMLVPIDFGHAFGSAVSLLPIPELMPFRLTSQFLGVLTPLEPEGLLKRSMAYVMTAMRANKAILRRTMQIFVTDPTVDWVKNASAQAKDQKGDVDKVQWLAETKIKAVESKLDGLHPSRVMLEELSHSQHQNIRQLTKKGSGICYVVEGDRRSVRKQLLEQSQGKGYILSPKQQVDALVDQARDPIVLSRTWVGWSPWY